MENQKQIQKFSNQALKWSKIIKIIGRVAAIITALFTITMFIFLLTGWAEDFVIEHADFFNKIKIDAPSDKEFLAIKSEVSLIELISMKKFDDLLVYLIGEGSYATVMCILILLGLRFFDNLFIKLSKAESPFNKEYINDIKKVFIIVGIISICSSIFIGIFISLALVCFYYIYKIGCDLQEENDEMI